MTGRAMRKTAMPRGRPPRPRRLRQRRKQRRSRRKRKSSVVSAQDVREAAAGLVGVAVRTPLRFIETLNVYLKLESLQPIGAFKLRGAYNAVRRLPEAARRNGVITYSSGNHGQALAYAAQLADVRTVLVPVGGGGLIAGVVTGLAAAGSRATVWGVEPAGAPKLKRSLEAGHPVRLERTASIADGLITLGVGDIPFAQLAAQRDRVAGVVLVVSGGNVDPSLLED